MATRQEIEIFLKELHVKIDIFGILFSDDRGKNQQTLLDLEITPTYREEIISSLKVEDYSQGPLEEKMHGILPMWVFGKKVKQKEVYIKISMGAENNNVIYIIPFPEQFKPNSSKSFNKELFTDNELKTLHSVTERFKNTSTNEMIDINHKEKAWIENCADKKLIDYKYAFELN